MLSDPGRDRWQLDFLGCRLELTRALEFWPLVGDTASQEAGGSRLVDASTIRLQILLRPLPDCVQPFEAWQLSIGNTRIPLRTEHDSDGSLRLLGLRLREFQPWIGLHPAIQPRMPLHLTLSHPVVERALKIQLHGWQPEGLPYTGLPKDLADAQLRREERLTYDTVPRVAHTALSEPHAACLTEYSMDLRWLFD